MKTAHYITSSCRYCRYYQAEGRRGGICHQLGVPVQGEWKACVLASHPFSTAWDQIEDLMRLENALALDSAETAPEAPTGLGGEARSRKARAPLKP